MKTLRWLSVLLIFLICSSRADAKPVASQTEVTATSSRELKSFSCDHGGLGNGNISGQIVVGKKRIFKNVVFKKNSNPEKPFSAKIILKVQHLTDDSLNLSGHYIKKNGKATNVGLSLNGKLKSGEASGTMQIGHMTLPVNGGNCTFTGL